MYHSVTQCTELSSIDTELFFLFGTSNSCTIFILFLLPQNSNMSRKTTTTTTTLNKIEVEGGGKEYKGFKRISAPLPSSFSQFLDYTCLERQGMKVWSSHIHDFRPPQPTLPTTYRELALGMKALVDVSFIAVRTSSSSR